MKTLYVVGTPIGNLNDITKRAIEILSKVDLIAVEDTRQTIKLLNHYQIKNKMIAYHKFNESKVTASLIAKLQSGLDIALVSDAGTPAISDPGYILVREARKNNLPVIGVPGASALTTSLSISGIPSNEFTFYGFLPSTSKELKKSLAEIAQNNILTNIFYESPKRLVKLIECLSEKFSHSEVSICSDLTKIHERNFYGPIQEVLSTIKDDPNIEKGEYVVILKREQIAKKEEMFTNEAIIINQMIQSNCSMKEAIELLIKENKYKRNELYQASLNLKLVIKEQNK